MRMNDIKAGCTYSEKRFGKITRTVLAIGREFHPNRIKIDGKGNKYKPVIFGKADADRPGVLFRQHGFNFDQKAPLDVFAAWAGKEVSNVWIQGCDAASSRRVPWNDGFGGASPAPTFERKLE